MNLPNHCVKKLPKNKRIIKSDINDNKDNYESVYLVCPYYADPKWQLNERIIKLQERAQKIICRNY